MQAIPLQSVPSQTLAVTLGAQACQINVYQNNYGLFLDLYVNGSTVPTIAGTLCLNDNRLLRDAYLGFSGDLVFNDTQGTSDPVYTGLGSRYHLVWLSPADLAAVGLAA